MKPFYLLFVLFFSVIFLSCSEDKESYAEWRKENEAHIEKIKNNPEYKATTEPKGGPGAIYYKVLKTPECATGISPIYTNKVKVRYKGSLIDETVFEDASHRTVELGVSNLVSGFAVALQNMQVGDKWEIHIPWELGYGYSGSGSTILPYSALIFELELLEISQY